MPPHRSDIRAGALSRIEAAFGDAPRPADEELLHERCFDDNDIVALYGVAHWREMPDAMVENEYAALSFLSPPGFRHFVPAYLSFTLRNVDMELEIRRLNPGEEEAVLAAGHLFDEPVRPDAARRFLDEPGHHLLLATEGGRAVGFVSGMEITHPDKGTEMLLYELGVEEAARRRGIGRALVEALAALARRRGCRGMWVATEPDNDAALATYASAGGRRTPPSVVLEWHFDDAPGPGNA